MPKIPVRMFQLPTLSLTAPPYHSEDDKLAWVDFRFDSVAFEPRDLALLDNGRPLRVRQFSAEGQSSKFQFKGVPEKAMKPGARLFDAAWPVRYEKRAYLVPLGNAPFATMGRLRSPLLPAEGLPVELKRIEAGDSKYLLAVSARHEFPCLTGQAYTVEPEGHEAWDAALVTCGALEPRDLDDFVRKTFRFSGLPTVNALYSIGLRVHGYTVLPPPLWKDEFDETVGSDGVRMMTKAWGQLSKKARNSAAQPGGISRDELERRMALPVPVLAFMTAQLIADGELKLVEGFYLPTAAPETYMSPVAQKLLAQLESWGERGIDLETEHNLLYEKTYRALARMGLGVATETPWVYSRAGWSSLRAKLCGPGTLGRQWRIAEVKDALDVTRKPLLGILNKLEEEGWLERKEDHRLVVKEVSE